VSLAIGRVRYLPLVLFVHSAYRFRVTPVLTGLMTVIIGAGIVLPFFVYSIIPNIMEIVVVLYAFFYWLLVYLMRRRLFIPAGRRELLRAVLVCSGFFLIGVLLDLLEGIPQVGVYISILLIEFFPLYLVSIGAVMAFWAVRDLYRPPLPEQPAGPRTIDTSSLPVTKREGEIIGLILGGETNASIASRLFISESTVKKHINNLFRKLRITSRWELLKLTGTLHPEK
jgi:DNA-binding CsgD family transcriptional regulator